MSGTENSSNDSQGNSERSGRADDRPGDDVAGWFAASTLRVALAFVGIVLLLFALGQAVGLDLLGMVADALATEVGRWMLVAVFALVLILLAVRGFGTASR